MKKMYFFFFIVLAIFFCACSKAKEDMPMEADTFPYFFTATINGISISYEANFVSRFGCGSSSRIYESPDFYNLYEGTVIKDTNEEGRNRIYVHVLKHFSPEGPTAEQRLAMFRVGSYNYGKLKVSDGAVITYTDENGVEWNSEDGSQVGSTFSLTEIADDDYVDAKRIKASFSCKLYASNGNSIQLSDGIISGRVLEP
jgi:hypothetical protein